MNLQSIIVALQRDYRINGIEFAQAAGISPRTLIRWTQGGPVKSRSLIAAAAHLCQYSPEIGARFSRETGVVVPQMVGSSAAPTPSAAAVLPALPSHLMALAEIHDLPVGALRRALTSLFELAEAHGWTTGQIRTALEGVSTTVDEHTRGRARGA